MVTMQCVVHPVFADRNALSPTRGDCMAKDSLPLTQRESADSVTPRRASPMRGAVRHHIRQARDLVPRHSRVGRGAGVILSQSDERPAPAPHVIPRASPLHAEAHPVISSEARNLS